MKIIVDTGVWSLALRRDKRESDTTVCEFRRIIQDHRVQMIGPIRQEILSGIRSESQFKKLQKHLESFPDFPAISHNPLSKLRGSVRRGGSPRGSITAHTQ
jgi:hypothetical protein